MIAAPPVRGRTYRYLAAVLGVHVAGLMASAALIGFALFKFAHGVGRVPAILCVIMAFVLAIITTGLLPIQLRGSPLRIPQSWFQAGDLLYTAAFGFGLGTGLLTALSSPGYYMVIVWGLSGAPWLYVLPVFIAFATGRALLFAVNVIRSNVFSQDGVALVDQSAVITGRLKWLEAGLLVACALVILLSHWPP